MKQLIFFFSLIICLHSFARGSKIKELEEQRKQALREIENTSRMLSDTKKTTATLLERIKLLSNQITMRQNLVALLGREIDGIALEQKRIENDVTNLEAELKEHQASYIKAINQMMRNRRSDNKLIFILSGRSLSQSYRRMRYLSEYSQWRSKQATEIKEKTQKLNERKVALAQTKASKIALLAQRTNEQDNLKKEEVAFEQERNEAQKKQGDLQKILAQKRNQAAALNKQIERLIAEEVARQEREAKRLAAEKAKKEAASASTSTSPRPSTSGTRESATAPKITEADMVLANDFSSNRGRLPYPISGNSTITTHFGTHQHSKYVTMSSSGIDLRSQAGADARAVFNGEVSRVFPVPGYNICIIIRHGNYYTFYGNIQNISVKQGDKVKTGQVLGRVYTDPDTNSSQLHFQLWQGTQKLNPEIWLR